MDWNIDFISQDDFKKHVTKTITKYGEKLKPYNLEKFNHNIIDPIKMVLDKAVYGKSWEELISSEIFRQRDKSNANEIGYFHQRIFDYIEGCHVPKNGTEGGWDVVFHAPTGYAVDEGNVVHTIYVEMKNKHNTMNSAASGKTYIKMQNQLLKDDDCACFLVEAIAKKSQNIVWTTSVDGQKVKHARIRRVSIDNFYEIVTGQKQAFYKICMVLPEVINEILSGQKYADLKPHDTVYEELKNMIFGQASNSEDANMALAIFMLGFETYSGFKTIK